MQAVFFDGDAQVLATVSRSLDLAAIALALPANDYYGKEEASGAGTQADEQSVALFSGEKRISIFEFSFQKLFTFDRLTVHGSHGGLSFFLTNKKCLFLIINNNWRGSRIFIFRWLRLEFSFELVRELKFSFNILFRISYDQNTLVNTDRVDLSNTCLLVTAN